MSLPGRGHCAGGGGGGGGEGGRRGPPGRQGVPPGRAESGRSAICWRRAVVCTGARRGQSLAGHAIDAWILVKGLRSKDDGRGEEGEGLLHAGSGRLVGYASPRLTRGIFGWCGFTLWQHFEVISS